jgi:hypothetical protein
MKTNRCLFGLIVALSVAPVIRHAHAQANPVLLQWFETEWDDIERRMPDFFMAGYGGVWLPPPSKASYQSAGYDPFDRFDLGQPPISATGSGRARTTYGTEESFSAMIDAFHRANALVYVDGIFNHNSGRTTSDAFIAQGSWPGFWIPRENPPRNKLPTDNWGDYHAGNAQGYLQSENPGGANYHLTNGDLVALIDIAPETNFQFIRNPVEAGNPLNIPAGTLYNLPDPGNTRFYPDNALTPIVVNNPGTSRNPGGLNYNRFPFNTADDGAGDAVTDNTTGYLMRWAQWMLEVQRIDGFRLDAHKHMPTWFWDTFFDSAVYNARIDPRGVRVIPFNFGENVSGNFDMLANYIRKDSFARRDSLDIQGSARLREVVNAGGFGSWGGLFSNADTGLLDIADDGLSNGSMGVGHVFSHDNGSVGDGGSMPVIPTLRQRGYPEYAFLLMRPGTAIVYHNGRGVPRSGGFYPREGVPNALGLEPLGNVLDDTMTNLVQLHNQIGIGQYFQLNGSISDVLVYERATNGFANCLVGVNDRFDAGVNTVSVTTQYAPGTRLHEQTGNAADPVVDPLNQIPELIVVGAGGQVTLTVPRNVSSTGTEHAKGFVVYSEAIPEGTLTISNQSGMIPADPTNFPSYFRRLNPVPVVSADSFRIALATSQADVQDPNTDDNALYKIDAGVADTNGSGGDDFPWVNTVLRGYEQFLTINAPIFGSGGTTGTYAQEIDATQLTEGFHYISTIAFRHREAFASPIFREWRTAIYIDRLDAALEVPGLEMPLDDPSFEFQILNPDGTVTAVHTFLDLEPGDDPVPMADIFNAANRWDRKEWRRAFDAPISDGPHTLTVVAFEHSGRATVLDLPFTVGDCIPDFTGDGVLDFFDVAAFLSAFSDGNMIADLTGDGVLDFFDVSAFLSAFSAGCP